MYILQLKIHFFHVMAVFVFYGKASKKKARFADNGKIIL